MNLSEKKLWYKLRGIGEAHFRRQVPIGKYVLDFYSHTARLCIEVDGDLHIGREVQDQIRDGYLTTKGIAILRITTGEVYRNIDGLVETIDRITRTRIGGDRDHWSSDERWEGVFFIQAPTLPSPGATESTPDSMTDTPGEVQA